MSSPTWTIPIDSSTTVAAVMSTPRSQFAAATGPDGRIYLAGGINNQGVAVKTVDVWDPVGKVMKPTGPLNVARYAFALVTAWDGGIWAIGGFTDASTATDIVERFDVASGKWTTDKSGNWNLPGPRGAVAAAVGSDNRIYVCGGQQIPPPPQSGTTDVFSLDPFNPAARWRAEPSSMNFARAGHTAATGIDGNIYVFGGDPGFGTVEMFDVLGRAWNNLSDTPLPGNPVQFGFATAAGPDGSIYLAGGHDGVSNIMNMVNALMGYTITAYWSPFLGNSNMPAPRDLAAAAVAEGELFVAGGLTNVLDPPAGMETYGPLPALSSAAVAWWRFQLWGPGSNDTTAMAYDSISKIGSQIYGGNHLHGKVIQGLFFGGTGYVDVLDRSDLRFGTSDWSVEFWVNIPASPVGIVPVLDNRTQSGHQYTGYHVFLDTGGIVGLQLANGSTSGISYANYLSTLAITPTVWTHVAICVDRTNLQITFYINGVNANGVKRKPWTGNADADVFVPLSGDISTHSTPGAPLYIGKHAFNSSHFKGLLDELTLYNKALSWIEVRSIFLAGSAGKA